MVRFFISSIVVVVVAFVTLGSHITYAGEPSADTEIQQIDSLEVAYNRGKMKRDSDLENLRIPIANWRQMPNGNFLTNGRNAAKKLVSDQIEEQADAINLEIRTLHNLGQQIRDSANRLYDDISPRDLEIREIMEHYKRSLFSLGQNMSQDKNENLKREDAELEAYFGFGGQDDFQSGFRKAQDNGVELYLTEAFLASAVKINQLPQSELTSFVKEFPESTALYNLVAIAKADSIETLLELSKNPTFFDTRLLEKFPNDKRVIQFIAEKKEAEKEEAASDERYRQEEYTAQVARAEKIYQRFDEKGFAAMSVEQLKKVSDEKLSEFHNLKIRRQMIREAEDGAESEAGQEEVALEKFMMKFGFYKDDAAFEASLKKLNPVQLHSLALDYDVAEDIAFRDNYVMAMQIFMRDQNEKVARQQSRINKE